jgi:Family of unknown function (DUF6982)
MAPSHRKVIARYLEGRLVKGYTFDFGPAQPRFHVFAEPSASGVSTRVFLRDLKPLFFVRDLVGDPARHDGTQFPPDDATGGHVEVRFRDGGLMVGTVGGSATDSPGFFLVPADPGSTSTCSRPPRGRCIRCRASRGAKAVVRPPLPDRLVSWLTR